VLEDQETRAWVDRTTEAFSPSPEVTLSQVVQLLPKVPTCSVFCCSDAFPKGLRVIVPWLFIANIFLPTVVFQGSTWAWAQVPFRGLLRDLSTTIVWYWSRWSKAVAFTKALSWEPWASISLPCFGVRAAGSGGCSPHLLRWLFLPEEKGLLYKFSWFFYHFSDWPEPDNKPKSVLKKEKSLLKENKWVFKWKSRFYNFEFPW